MKIKGITKRWATNTLLVTALILLVLLSVCVVFVIGYYRNYVTNYLSGYANESVTTFFSPYVSGSDEIFNEKAKEFVDSFSDKNRMEVQVVNRKGTVSFSSSGFDVSEKIDDMDDVKEALESTSGISKWSGFNGNGEHIMAVSMILPRPDGEFTGAVRFITSLRAIDRQIIGLIVLILVVYFIALFFVALSGIFFIQTIVTPVRKINDAARQFSEGDFDVRIESDGRDDDEITELADSINGMIAEVAATDKLKNDLFQLYLTN